MSDISEGLRVTLTSLAVFGALFLTAMTMQWLAYDERQQRDRRERERKAAKLRATGAWEREDD